MRAAIETTALSKRYRRAWALRDCSLSLPAECSASPAPVRACTGPEGGSMGGHLAQCRDNNTRVRYGTQAPPGAGTGDMTGFG